MDSHAAHNAARIADRQSPNMAAEVRAAARNLRDVFPDLFSWYTDLTDLLNKEPSDATTSELHRLIRNAGIVGEAVNQARSHTREASRLSQQMFPLPEQDAVSDGR
jgi:hypothetical protein